MRRDSIERKMISAHRFGLGDRAELENTREALLAATELDCEFIEFDVQRCKDGQLVIFHDHRVELDNRLQRVDALDFSDFKRTPENFLLFEEALELLKGKKKAHLDFKFKSPEILYEDADVECAAAYSDAELLCTDTEQGANVEPRADTEQSANVEPRADKDTAAEVRVEKDTAAAAVEPRADKNTTAEVRVEKDTAAAAVEPHANKDTAASVNVQTRADSLTKPSSVKENSVSYYNTGGFSADDPNVGGYSVDGSGDSSGEGGSSVEDYGVDSFDVDGSSVGSFILGTYTDAERVCINTCVKTYEVQAAIEAIEILGSSEIIITSLEDESVRVLRQWSKLAYPDLLVGLSLGRDLSEAGLFTKLQTRLDELFPKERFERCDANLIAANKTLASMTLAWFAAKRRLPLLVWTVDESEDLLFWLNHPAVWMTATNFPKRALEIRS